MKRRRRSLEAAAERDRQRKSERVRELKRPGTDRKRGGWGSLAHAFKERVDGGMWRGTTSTCYYYDQ